MTDKTPENEAATPEETSAAAAPETAAPEVSLEEEIRKLKDQHLRALAEVENIRRRAQKESEETAKYAVSNFAREMLTISDNFRRALDAVPKDETENSTLTHLVVGVEATERQLLASLERFGIKKIESAGKLFDPHLHRVMTEMEDPSQPAGTIVQVLQDGYMIHDRLLREALVVVSKGGAPAHKIDTSA